MSKTTILLKSTTRNLLKQIGRKEQTYDDIIAELIRLKDKEDHE